MWLFLNGEQILMKMKTQVDMININTEIFSFYDLHSNFGHYCAANFAQIWLFLNGEQILMKMKTQVDMINLNTKIFRFYDCIPILDIIVQPILRNIGYFLQVMKT